MKNKTYIIVLLLSVFFFPSKLKSQDGSPYIVNYEIDKKYNLRNWAIIQDHNQIMFFANRKGILTFDGHEWDLISLPSLPLVLKKHPSENIVIVGCNNDIGYISKDIKGNYTYYPAINDSIHIGFIVDMEICNDELIVLSDGYITIFNLDDFVLKKQLIADDITIFNSLIKNKDQIFVCTEDNRFFKLEDDTLSTFYIEGFGAVLYEQIIFDSQFDSSNNLLGLSNNQLYIFDGKKIDPLKIEEQKYLNESILLYGLSLTDSSFSVSTLIGGIIIINKKTGKTIYSVNYSTGLPDDEIFAAAKDVNNGLWVSHALGISRIDMSVPILKFSHYPGIKGNLLSVVNFNNKIYVGSSEGVFYLDEVKDYKEKEVTIKVKQQIQQPKIEEPQPTIIEPDEDDTKGKRGRRTKNFFNKLVQKVEEPVKYIVSKEPDKEASSKRQVSKTVYQKKKILEFQAVSHMYKEISGLDDKCKQILIFHNKIIVAGNNGIYEIINNKSKQIVPNRYINRITPSQITDNRLYACTNQGLIILNLINNNWEVNINTQLNNDNIYSLYEKDSIIWLGTDKLIYKLLPGAKKGEYKLNKYIVENIYSDPILVEETDGKINFFLPSKVYYYDLEKDSVIINDKFIEEDEEEASLSYISSQNNIFWIYRNNIWELLNYPDNYNREISIYLSLFDGVENIFIDNNKNLWVIDENNTLNKIKYQEGKIYNPELSIYIKSITDLDGIQFDIADLKLSYKNNSLKFSFTAPFYIKSNAVKYQYYIEGLMKKWADWEMSSIIDFPYIPSGKYTLIVRAKNILGNTSHEEKISFYIKKPVWLRGWFIIIEIIILITLVVIIIKLRERKLQRDKRILEQKVRERTATIQKQKDELAKRNEEILQQKEEIEAQRDEITEQRDKIVKQNEEITDSIQYAKRIQNAVLPSVDMMDNLLPDYFVLFKPRDIVSGDFFWMNEKDGKVIVVAADCTGHGVPGAFMSMLGVSFLNEIVNKGKITQANKILNQLRAYVKNTLSQTGKDDEAKDGMDVALCVFDFKTSTLQYAGAYNPLYLIRGGEIYETKADKMPIGIYHAEKESFTNHEIKIKKGDTFYIFSDGFIDQFGGDSGRKFMAKPFKKLLAEIQTSSMEEQKFILNETIETWRGGYKQIDDIIIFGIRIK
ncbi:MAG: SpoIIE family protein phosphatase [Bacteroidales bacterium]|nr:SpoIIE family protein phosphatase [Bacteroidales bacterium]